MSVDVTTRVVESKSLKVGKSLKIGKKSDKIGKIGFDFLLDFLAKIVPYKQIQIVLEKKRQAITGELFSEIMFLSDTF